MKTFDMSEDAVALSKRFQEALYPVTSTARCEVEDFVDALAYIAGHALVCNIASYDRAAHVERFRARVAEAVPILESKVTQDAERKRRPQL